MSEHIENSKTENKDSDMSVKKDKQETAQKIVKKPNEEIKLTQKSNTNKVEINTTKEIIKEEESIQNYLSSNNLDMFKEVINQKEEKKTLENINKSYFLIKFILCFVQFFIFPLFLTPAILFFSVFTIVPFFTCKSNDFILLMWILICCCSYIYSMVCFMFFPVENYNIRLFQSDGIFFSFTQILVFSYLKTIYCNEEPFCDMIQDTGSNEQIGTLVYSHFDNIYEEAYFLDYKQYRFTFREEISAKGYSKISNLFSYFLDNVDKINQPINSVDNFVQIFAQFFFPDFKHFFFLSGIILIKLSFCFYYIFMQEQSLTKKEIIDMVVIIFLYIYTTFNLNRILGNNDLKRKYEFMVAQNQYIDFKQMPNINLKEKIDITCPISLESWDNTRKVILTHENNWLETLELSYFCLFLYLIFAILVCLSSYFELYWIFSEKSFLLNPIIVIMSSFNSIFMSAFLLIRFYEGDKFNSTFEELNGSLVYLLDTTTDLQTIFDYHFNNDFFKKTTTQKKEKRKDGKVDVYDYVFNSNDKQYNIYTILVKKIKLQSKYHIREQVEYLGRKYNKQEKNKLRKKMLMNMKVTLEKIKESLQNDSINCKYKFLNLIEVNFKDILVTLAFGLVTTLPTIIPKFQKLFNFGNTEQQYQQY